MALPLVLQALLRGAGLLGSSLARGLQALISAGDRGEGDEEAVRLLGELGAKRAAERLRGGAHGRPGRLGPRERAEARAAAEAAGRLALASALKKILGWHRRGWLRTGLALGRAPLFFASPVRPILPESLGGPAGRILALDPGWNGAVDKVYPVPDSMMGGREGGGG